MQILDPDSNQAFFILTDHGLIDKHNLLQVFFLNQTKYIVYNDGVGWLVSGLKLIKHFTYFDNEAISLGKISQRVDILKQTRELADK